MPDTIAEKLAARRLKTPPPVIYPLLGGIWKLLFYGKLGVHIDRRFDYRQLKGPYIVVSNHASRLDYLYTGIAMLGHRFNFVAGYNEFFRSHLAGIFSIMQVIPKKNFVADVYAVKEIARILRSGGRIVLFPEGMSSINGANQPCAIGSGKLIKHFAVPVLYCKISGGYMTSTKFDLAERPGRVDVVIDRLLTPEQINDMSAGDIQALLDEKLYNDDYEWNRTAKVDFHAHGEPAKGLHTLLYRCPKCGRDMVMEASGDVIRCKECGNGARVSERCELIPLDDGCVIPGTIRAWHDMQRDAARAEVYASDGPYIKDHVKLGTLPKYKRLKNQATSEITGEGDITLDGDGFHFRGSRYGAPFEFDIEPALLPTYGMCTDISRFYTFASDGEFYEFYPERPCVMKWFLLTEELHRKCGGAWVDTRRAQPNISTK